MLEVNVEVKPSRLLSTCSFLPRALPPVTNIGKPICIAFQARLSCPLDLSGEPSFVIKVIKDFNAEKNGVVGRHTLFYAHKNHPRCR